MRILIIGSHPKSLINFRGRLLRDMVDAGHKLWACAFGNDNVVESDLRTIGVVYKPIFSRRTGTNVLSDTITFVQIYRFIRQIRPHVVLSYTIKPVIYGGIAAMVCHVPHIYSMITGLGYAFTEVSGFKHRFINILARLFYKISLMYSEKVFFQNPDDRDYFVTLKIVRIESTVLLNGSGVDLLHYKRVALPRKTNFLLIARLISDKGIREYVAAALEVKKVFPGIKFFLAGDLDPNPNAITSREIRTWQKDKTIIYHGYLEDVRPAIAAASVFVLPSYREGVPRAVLEAMSMARAIICTDAPGCRETVKDGYNGFLVPIKRVEELKQAMLKFVEDPDLAPRMGEHAYQIAVAKFDVCKVNTIILESMGLK